jgi:hypothetical protein
MSGGVEGYEVQLEALDRASAAYHSQASVVNGYREGYLSKATLDDKAFGNLPQSAQLAEQYKRFFDRVQTDVKTLSASLADGGSKLSTSADNYRKAESASTID